MGGTLALVRQNVGQFAVHALVAGENYQALLRWRANSIQRLSEFMMKANITTCVIWSVISIVMSLLENSRTDIAAMPVDLVVAGISVLLVAVVMAAVCSGQTIAIANKEHWFQQEPL